MTARKNFTNYWQLDPGFLSQLTGNSDKLEAQGPIMAKAGTVMEEDYDPSVDDDLANLLSGITPNEMSVVQGTWEWNPLKMTFGWTIGDSDKYVVAFKSGEKPEEETVEEEPEEEKPEECPKDENPKVLSSTSWGCPGSQLPNNILHSNVLMSRPLLWQVPRHQYLLLGRGRADRQQGELLVGTEREGRAWARIHPGPWMLEESLWNPIEEHAQQNVQEQGNKAFQAARIKKCFRPLESDSSENLGG